MQNFSKLPLLIGLLYESTTFGYESRAIGITVIVRPGATLAMKGTSAFELKVRLAPKTHAIIWRTDSCGVAPVTGHRILKSGVYSVSLEQIGFVGSIVCVASSDGVLLGSVEIPFAQQATAQRASAI